MFQGPGSPPQTVKVGNPQGSNPERNGPRGCVRAPPALWVRVWVWVCPPPRGCGCGCPPAPLWVWVPPHPPLWVWVWVGGEGFRL